MRNVKGVSNTEGGATDDSMPILTMSSLKDCILIASYYNYRVEHCISCICIILITLFLRRTNTFSCFPDMKPLYCYECQTSSDDPNYCSDPFNATMLAQNVSICEGHCVKWVRQPRPGQ